MAVSGLLLFFKIFMMCACWVGNNDLDEDKVKSRSRRWIREFKKRRPRFRRRRRPRREEILPYAEDIYQPPPPEVEYVPVPVPQPYPVVVPVKVPAPQPVIVRQIVQQPQVSVPQQPKKKLVLVKKVQQPGGGTKLVKVHQGSGGA